ncbi:hypothetical protein BDZ91DRAFT_303292 [Kalaharituber pfeilii]|nr:hypothetical protein BDZ91DRAFT_303292 [Kalaharituber pfeilii]
MRSKPGLSLVLSQSKPTGNKLPYVRLKIRTQTSSERQKYGPSTVGTMKPKYPPEHLPKKSVSRQIPNVSPSERGQAPKRNLAATAPLHSSPGHSMSKKLLLLDRLKTDKPGQVGRHTTNELPQVQQAKMQKPVPIQHVVFPKLQPLVFRSKPLRRWENPETHAKAMAQLGWKTRQLQKGVVEERIEAPGQREMWTKILEIVSASISSTKQSPIRSFLLVVKRWGG